MAQLGISFLVLGWLRVSGLNRYSLIHLPVPITSELEPATSVCPIQRTGSGSSATFTGVPPLRGMLYTVAGVHSSSEGALRHSRPALVTQGLQGSGSLNALYQPVTVIRTGWYACG